MLVKLTFGNRLTLPLPIVDAVGKPTHFQVSIEDGRLVLTPTGTRPADAVRRKLALRGLQDTDVIDAVAWARSMP